ncbi:MAG TPA: VOC family protein [Gaiellaceae bacterium]|nr:VOC family protein [Gaiellaceae bacterium]
MAVNPIPEGYHSLNAYLAVDDAAAAIEYYTEVFGAKERLRMDGPDGKIGHAELQIGDSVLMLADTNPQSSYTPPKELGGTSAGLLLYVEDVDAVVTKATEAGATLTMPVEDMFWGDRFGQVTDPFGHGWQIATRKEDLTEEEIAERGKAAMAAMS